MRLRASGLTTSLIPAQSWADNGRRAAALGLLLLAPMTAFGAEDLKSLYEQAVKADPELLSMQAAAGIADARDRQARGQILPQISGSASYSKVKQEQDFDEDALPPGFGNSQSDEEEDYEDNQALRLDLKQPLFNWAAFQAKKGTMTRRQQAQEELRFRESELLVTVASRYYDVLSAEADVAAAERRREAVDVQLKRAQAAFESGLSPITDLQQAQSRLDSVRVDAISARNEQLNRLDQLSRLTGKVHGALQAPAAPYRVAPPEEGGAEQWVKKAVANNPILRAKQLAVQATEHDVRQQRGNHYPTLDFKASIGETEQPVDFGFGNTQLVTDTSSYGLELTVPIFSGGTTSARVEEAILQQEQARQDMILTRRQLETETRTAYRNLHASAAQVQALEQAIQSAETAVKAAKAGQQSGTRNILDVLEAELELIQRQTDLKSAWYAYRRNGLLLRHLAGELSPAALNDQVAVTAADQTPDIAEASAQADAGALSP